MKLLINSPVFYGSLGFVGGELMIGYDIVG
jgi:hypothetical protein